MAQNDPGLFIQTYPPPLIINEVQYAPQLFSYIKIIVDSEKKNGMFWLIGSQKFHLMQGITESLSGRIAIINLLGLSQAEIDGSYKNDKPFLSILEASGIIYLLKPYHSNLTKRLVKAPKIYFLDTGLCTYLMKWPNGISLEQGAVSGAILETYLFTEILKSYWHNGLEAYFYYYRDIDKKEIDLVIESGDHLYPIEFKKNRNSIKNNIQKL